MREHCRLRGVGFCQHRSAEHHRFTNVSVILLATAATPLACGALAYVVFVRPIAAFDCRVEACGLLLSFLGTILGLVTLPFGRWFSSLALGVSAWMLVLFFWLVPQTENPARHRIAHWRNIASLTGQLLSPVFDRYVEIKAIQH